MASRLNSENLYQHKKHQETPHGTSFSVLVNRHPSSNVNLPPLVTSASRKERFVFPEFVSQSSFAEGGPFEELCILALHLVFYYKACPWSTLTILNHWTRLWKIMDTFSSRQLST
ncbi:hypothetical protein P8452_38141 [Trifolium repens]|nr:hypothetical protein P8452_38141 [Trifolium repens]